MRTGLVAPKPDLTGAGKLTLWACGKEGGEKIDFGVGLVSVVIWTAVFIAASLVGGWALLRRGMRWGSTADERARRLPGDEYLEGGASARVAMTRAIWIRARPENVWPWVAQLGRGAGWYSFDWLDNGRKTSAWHLVSWIPEPRPGDATAIGYLRQVTRGQSVAWWLDGGKFLGARSRAVTCFSVDAEGGGTRLVSRMSADAAGLTAHIALLVFRIIDSIMARRQLVGIRDRVEHGEAGLAAVRDPETGDRDQYQLYEILYADGTRAGVAGKEEGARWRRSAIGDGVLEGPE